MSKGQSLQDPFLNALRKDRIPVSIFLVNGIKLQGQIESFDQYVVLLKNTVSQMVYKHAISTVVPTRNPRTDGVPSGGVAPYAGSAPQGGGFGMSSGYPNAVNQGFDRQGFDRAGFGAAGMSRPVGGFTRTVPNQGFDRIGHAQGGFGQGFDRPGFDERGFDGKKFEQTEERSFDNKGFDAKFGSEDFDK